MENRTDTYLDLRCRYPLFEYLGFLYRTDNKGFHLEFDFRMGDVRFRPTALIERRAFLDFDLPAEVLDRLVFDIGLVELVSYWKSACPPLVRIACGTLSPEQAAFWKKLYWHGLGEFFYTNGISETQETFLAIENSKMKIESSLPHSDNSQISTLNSQSYLVPIGGGKDSVVTLELLRRAGRTIRPLIMNPRGATVECARVAGFPIDEVLVIRRTIDPTLLALNSQGYLNGHTPFSAMLAFYTRLASAFSGIPNVALSNENSANEPTVLVRDQSGANGNMWSSVNHQYSKSLEFEDDFRAYCNNPNSQLPIFNYFSFLRPLSELQIAMLFSRFTAYHDVFRSCNAGSKQDIWCGHCAKCLFAYIILSPFIEPQRLNAIFGKSMLDDLTLLTEFRQLVGLEDTKPFECVGTVSEVRQALAMALRRWYSSAPTPALLNKLEELEKLEIQEKLDNLSPIGNLSPEERNILQQACTENNN